MNTIQTPKSAKAVFSIPNLLSLFRILLIPVFVWTYFGLESPLLAFGILVLSGLTDVVDGYIARHFNMITDLGKALDPIADKLTQVSVFVCLAGRFPFMILLAALLFIKEVVSGFLCLSAIKKTNQVIGADWHGKVTTCLIYATMLLHLLWNDIPESISILSAGLCIFMMILSFVLYLKRHLVMLKH